MFSDTHRGEEQHFGTMLDPVIWSEREGERRQCAAPQFPNVAAGVEATARAHQIHLQIQYRSERLHSLLRPRLTVFRDQRVLQ